MCAVTRPVAGQSDEYNANSIGSTISEQIYAIARRLVSYALYQRTCIGASAAFERLGLSQLWWWAMDAALPG